MQTCPGFFLQSLLESPGNLLEICSVKFVDTLWYVGCHLLYYVIAARPILCESRPGNNLFSFTQVSVAVPVCGRVVYTVYCVFLLLSVLFAAGGRSLFVQSEWHWTNDSAVVLGTFWGTYSFYLTLLHLAIVRLFHGFVHQIHLCQFVVGNFRNNCFQLDVLFMDEWVVSMLSKLAVSGSRESFMCGRTDVIVLHSFGRGCIL